MTWSSLGAVGTKEQARRGLGVHDLATAIEGRPHRANATFALHILDSLTAVQTSSDRNSPGPLTTTCDRPVPLPAPR